MIDAPVLPCVQCGVPLALDPTAATATCRYCRAETSVPDAIRQAAREYNRKLQQESARMSFAERFSTEGAIEKGTNAFMVLVFGLSIVFAISQTLPAFVTIPVKITRFFVPGFVVLLILSIVGFFFAIPFLIRRDRIDENAVIIPSFVGGVPGSCSHCGAPVRFSVGQAETGCKHCSRTVIATPQHHEVLLDIAGQQADLASAKATRTVFRSFAGGGAGAITGMVEGIFFLIKNVLPGGILIFMGTQFLPAHKATDVASRGLGKIGLGMILGGVLVILGSFLVSVLLRSRSKGQVLRQQLAKSAQRYRGQLLGSGAKPVIDWLDTNWADSVPSDVITSQNSDQGVSIVRSSAAFSFEAFPVLIATAWAPHIDRTDLFLAAYKRKGKRAKLNLQSGAAAELKQAGFDVVVNQAGVHVSRIGTQVEWISTEQVNWVLSRAAQLV